MTHFLVNLAIVLIPKLQTKLFSLTPLTKEWESHLIDSLKDLPEHKEANKDEDEDTEDDRDRVLYAPLFLCHLTMLKC